MKNLKILFLSLALSLLSASISMAAGVVGTGTALSCDEAAFDAALVGGGAITFNCGVAPHTIAFTSVKSISANTSIDGNSLITLSGGNVTKLFDVSPGNSFTLTNIILADGACSVIENGGAVSLYGPGTVGNFTNVSFQSNTCVNLGSAIYASDTSLTISDNTFDGNTAPSSGVGALYLSSSTGSIANSVFSNNSALDNAAMSILGGSSIDIQRSYFYQNSSTGNSVLEVQSGASATIGLCNFYQNNGGVSVLNNAGTISISRSSFYDNASGILIYNSGDLTLTNSTIGGNDLTASTAAVAIGGTGVNNIINSTIADNFNGFSSGGVSTFSLGASVNIADSIISNNAPLNCSGSGLISFGGNIESANNCNFNQVTDLINTNPLLTPIDIGIFFDFPGNNSYFYSLQNGSPAIDHATGVVGVDQQGTVRPIDGDNNSIAIPDSGAIERTDFSGPTLAQITPVTTPSSNPSPSYTFSSSEAGNITYGGSCSSPTTTAVVGNNTITFNPLAVGVYSNCTITVTDAFLNDSLPLFVNSFEIISSPVLSSGGGGGGSAAFGKSACSGAECSGEQTVTEVTSEPVISAENINFFTDISGHWAENYIKNLHDKCQIDGFKDGNGQILHLFKPDQPITRAELVSMILKCQNPAGIPNLQQYSPTFPDLANHWAFNLIGLVEKLKIVSGYPDGTFKPDQHINRAEALKILMLAFFEADQITGENSSCRDIVPNSWYTKYFQFALNQGIVKGYDAPVGTCAPDWKITRAEVAKIISLIK